MITPEQLSSWSRTPGPPAINAPLADEGDRRWLWGTVLVLLAVEAWLRRRREGSVPAVVEHSEAGKAYS